MLASAMVILCLVVVLRPIWRVRNDAAYRHRHEANVEIYRQRRAEIDRDVAANRITEADARQEIDELGVRLLEDVDAEPGLMERSAATSAGPARDPGLSWFASLVLLLFIASGAAAYGWLANWQAVDKAGMPDTNQFIGQLKANVRAHPKDRDARRILAQTQRRQGDNAEAAANFHVLNQSGAAAPDPALIAAEADATLAAGGDLAGHAGTLYSQLLKLDPGNREALWYLGLRAAEEGNDAMAIQFWNRLLSQNLSPEARAMVSTRRDSLRAKQPHR
ncbi:c-type cytochrome biogenesis protein CcmI [Salinisphaera hydrothermalis]|uniref:c-type cytochrome biogenesis protein CcmI n=1 Tax=Salinisphaera hydrothermalis TaxID=563188 RepID=UPI003341EDAA